jgi:hypothetical protein
VRRRTPRPLRPISNNWPPFGNTSSSTGKLASQPFGAPKFTSVDPWALLLSVEAAVAIFRFKVELIPTLVACCAIGMLLFYTGMLSQWRRGHYDVNHGILELLAISRDQLHIPGTFAIMRSGCRPVH